jgi:hypothetical protein
MPLPDGSPTRGERNANPGNILYTPHVPYKGLLGPEIVPDGAGYSPIFGRFDTPQNGIRAIGVCLLAYFKHHGLNTIRGLIMRWSATDQEAYVKDVTRWFFGLAKDAPDAVIQQHANQHLIVNSATTLQGLIDGIIRQENGGDSAYSSDMMSAAAHDALAGYLA